MTIHSLTANQPADRFYRGGSQIARFRHRPDDVQFVPEDWVGSTTTLFGEQSLGLSRLPDGRLLVEAVTADPTRWLGPDHVQSWGADTKLLVKLLDAGQRLPVHAHPDAQFAQEHLQRRHGKAEAWHILTGGQVYLGLRESVTVDQLEDLVRRQQTDDLLALLHCRTVTPGDTVFVPPGTLHAIGEGVFIVEVQEPEDLSILLEWQGFELDGAQHGHLGLGFPTALTAVTRSALTAEQVDQLILPGEAPAQLPSTAHDFFRLERLQLPAGDRIDEGFAVIVVVDGNAELRRGDGAYLVASGDTLVAEHRGGPITTNADLDIVVLRPPVPATVPTD